MRLDFDGFGKMFRGRHGHPKCVPPCPVVMMINQIIEHWVDVFSDPNCIRLPCFVMYFIMSLGVPRCFHLLEVARAASARPGLRRPSDGRRYGGFHKWGYPIMDGL